MRRVFFLIAVFLAISLASATFQKSDVNGIETSYGPGSSVRGWINMSFNNENSSSEFNDNYGNKVSLIELLDLNNIDYDCTPSSCGFNYELSNPEKTKQFSIPIKEDVMKGFGLVGDIESVDAINLSFVSDAEPSCFNQIEIDFFDDGVIDFVNTKSSSSVCPMFKDYGCFNLSKASEERELDVQPYCQKVKLSKSPGFKVGAWVKKVSGNSNLSVSIYSTTGQNLEKSCKLPDASVSGGEIECDIEFPQVDEKEVYICLREEGDGLYRTKGYADINGCGFYGSPLQTRNAAFHIYAQGKRYGSPGEIKISNKFVDGSEINFAVQNYLRKEYGANMVCPESKCVIPIRILAEDNQLFSIKDIKLRYSSFGPATLEDIYDINENPPIINSGFKKINLDNANFTLPKDYGNKTWVISFEGEEILRKDIVIERVPEIEYLSPLTSASAVPTLFKIGINSTQNITKYSWEWGDGKNETTLVNSAMHTYNNSGSYNVRVGATDKNGRSSYREFILGVGSPEEIVNITLKKKIEDLSNVKEDMKIIPEFYLEEIEKVVDSDYANSEIVKLQREYELAQSEEDYKEIITKLLNLTIPEKIFESKKVANFDFYPSKESIDLDGLELIGGGSYDSGKKEEYVDEIYGWYIDNMDVKMDFVEYSGQYDGKDIPILRTFDLRITAKNSLKFDPKIIIKDLEGIEFKDEYLQSEEGGYIYSDLNEESMNIVFVTRENVDFSNLPMFISPDLSRISLTEGNGSKDVEEPNWLMLSLILAFLGIFGLTGYLFMSAWYKRNYENYLFKNKNNLHNLLAYIHNSKQKGVGEKLIEERLKKAGWDNEQINYALNKHAGKETGLPLGDLFDKLFKRDKKVEIPKGVKPGENPFLNRNQKRY